MRFGRRPLRGRFFRPRAHPIRRRLRKAHRAMEAGRPAEAGKIFAELAEAAASLDRPIASQLLLQAGRAYLAAGEKETARSLVMRGIRMMIEQGDPRLGPLSQRWMAELRDRGFPDIAQDIDENIPAELRKAPSTSSAPPSPALPAKCPYCGGSVRADQVDRTEPDRPACAYCGTPLLGDERAHG